MTPTLIVRTPAQIAADAAARTEAAIAAAIDARVESQARTLGYNSAAHLAGYAASTVPQWAAEAQAFVAWRDAVWLAAFAAREAALATGHVPSLDATVAALPRFPLPQE